MTASVDYVKQRRMFGSTLAAYQVVHHRLAEAHRALRQVELTPYPSPLAGRVASEASRVGVFAK